MLNSFEYTDVLDMLTKFKHGIFNSKPLLCKLIILDMSLALKQTKK